MSTSNGQILFTGKKDLSVRRALFISFVLQKLLQKKNIFVHISKVEKARTNEKSNVVSFPVPLQKSSFNFKSYIATSLPVLQLLEDSQYLFEYSKPACTLGVCVDIVKVDASLVPKNQKRNFFRDIENSFYEVTHIGLEPHQIFSF